MVRSPVLALLFLTACTQAVVVKEGSGWREVQSSGSATTVEVTTTDPRELAEIARTNPDPRLRAAAVAKIADPVVLAEIAKKDSDPAIRKSAIERVSDRVALADIAQTDSDDGVRAAAAERRDLVRFLRPGHPEHAGWVSRAPGSWIRLRAELRVGDRTSQTEVLRTVTASSPAGISMEQRDATSRRALTGTVKDMLDRADFPAGTKQEGEDTADIGGRKVPCHTVLWSGQYGRIIARIKYWLCDQVPGGLARIDIEESPEGEPLRYLRVRVQQWGP
jgi:hypothetical protein